VSLTGRFLGVDERVLALVLGTGVIHLKWIAPDTSRQHKETITSLTDLATVCLTRGEDRGRVVPEVVVLLPLLAGKCPLTDAARPHLLGVLACLEVLLVAVCLSECPINC